MMIKPPYRVPSSAYIRVYLMKYGKIPAIIAALLLCAALIAGLNDLRWCLIALMGLFLVAPMSLSMAYFIVAGRKDIAIRLHPYTIQNTQKGILLSFFPFDTVDQNQEPILCVPISADNITRVISSGKFTRIHLLNDEPFDFLLVPTDAFPSSLSPID